MNHPILKNSQKYHYQDWLQHKDGFRGLFELYYDDICRDLGEQDHVDYGSEAHIERIMGRVARSEVFHNKGMKVAMRSFFKWERTMKQFLKDWTTMLFALIILGIRQGWFQNGVLPGIGKASSILRTQLQGLQGVERAEEQGGEAANQSTKALREKCVNALHVCAEILGNERKRWVCHVIAALAEPLQIYHDVTIKNGFKDEMSVLGWYKHMATWGEGKTVLKQILGVMVDTHKVAELGFGVEARQLAMNSDKDVVKLALQEEREKASDVWNFALLLVKFRSVSASMYADGWPGPFALLVNPEVSEKKLVLEKCKVFWKAIRNAEEIAHRDPKVAGLLRAVVYNRVVPFRETWLHLEQFGFEWIPPQVSDVWACIFCGFGTSEVVEDGFNAIKDGQRNSKNMEMSRTRRWCTAIDKQVITERYKRKEVQGGATRPMAGKGWLGDSSFESQGGDVSCEDSILREVMLEKAPWITFSAQTQHRIPAAVNLLLQASARSTWAIIEHAWLSLLFVEGLVVRSELDRRYWVVLYTCQYGWLGWAMERKVPKRGGGVLFRPHSNCNKPEWHCVLSLDHWRGFATQCLGPLGLRGHLDEADPWRHCLALWSNDVKIPIVECAGRAGFPGMTDAWLAALLKFWGVELTAAGPKPTTISGKLELLLRHVFPKMNDEEIAGILLRRGAKQRRKEEASGECYAGKAEVEDVLDADDKVQCREDEERRQNEKERTDRMSRYVEERRLVKQGALGSRSLTTAAGVPSSSRSGSSNPCNNQPQAAKRGPRKVPPENVKNAKEHMPKVKGVVLQPYMDKRKYQVYYPTSDGFQKSKTYTWSAQEGVGFSSSECLRACVDWAWAQHERETGEARPWDWQES